MSRAVCRSSDPRDLRDRLSTVTSAFERLASRTGDTAHALAAQELRRVLVGVKGTIDVKSARRAVLSKPGIPLAPAARPLVTLRAAEGGIADARALLAAASAPGVTNSTRRDAAHRAQGFACAAVASISFIGETATAKGPLRARVRALVLEGDAIFNQATALLVDRRPGASVVTLTTAR